MMVGLRVNRLELDEVWGFVGKKQKRMTRKDVADGVKGDQYTYIGLAGSTRASNCFSNPPHELISATPGTRRRRGRITQSWRVRNSVRS